MIKIKSSSYRQAFLRKKTRIKQPKPTNKRVFLPKKGDRGRIEYLQEVRRDLLRGGIRSLEEVRRGLV